MRYPLVTKTEEAGVRSWAEYRCCHSITDTSHYTEQKAVACTLLAFQRFGQVLSILCTNSNAQARDVKFTLTLKASKVNPTWIMLNMRVVSENAPWFTSGSHTSLFPKFQGKLNKTQKCSSVSEEVFELEQKIGHCGSDKPNVQSSILFFVFFFNCCSGPDLQIPVWWEQNKLVFVMIRYSEDTIKPFHNTQRQTVWHHCYCGECFQPNICLHNNISEKYPASHAVRVNKSSITTKINKLRWHSYPNSSAVFTRPCRKGWRPHRVCVTEPRHMSSFTFSNKMTASSFATSVVQVYMLQPSRQMFCCVWIHNAAGIQEKEKSRHPVFLPLGRSMWLLALSGTSEVLQQVGDLELPLSVTQAF